MGSVELEKHVEGGQERDKDVHGKVNRESTVQSNSTDMDKQTTL